MAKRAEQQPLGYRERQLVDVVHQLGEATVAEVREVLPDPPGYSSVRKMLSVLEEKGLLKHRQDGKRYVYRVAQSKQSAIRSAIDHLLTTFFSGSATEAVNAILDASQDDLDEADFVRLRQTIEHARKEGK